MRRQGYRKDGIADGVVVVAKDVLDRACLTMSGGMCAGIRGHMWVHMW